MAGLRLQASTGQDGPRREHAGAAFSRSQVLHAVSRPRRGPRVVGVFSYRAGNGSGESERRRPKGTKGGVAPGLGQQKLPVQRPDPGVPEVAP